MSKENGRFRNPLKFMYSLLFGALVGAMTMLFVAPHSGEETRAILTEKKDDMMDRVEDTQKRTRKQWMKMARQAEKSMDHFEANVEKRMTRLEKKIDSIQEALRS